MELPASKALHTGPYKSWVHKQLYGNLTLSFLSLPASHLCHHSSGSWLTLHNCEIHCNFFNQQLVQDKPNMWELYHFFLDVCFGYPGELCLALQIQSWAVGTTGVYSSRIYRSTFLVISCQIESTLSVCGCPVQVYDSFFLKVWWHAATLFIVEKKLVNIVGLSIVIWFNYWCCYQNMYEHT